MKLYEIILEIVIITFCTSTFVYSATKIFKKETPRYLVFLCLADLCFVVEELCATIYWLVNPTGAFLSFQVSILGTISIFLFLFTASFAILERLIKKEDQSRKISIVSIIAPLFSVAVYTLCLFVCINKNLKETIFPLAIMILPVAACSYYSLKYILLRKKSEVCKTTFKLNLLVLFFCLSTLGYVVTYLTTPPIVSEIVNLICAVLLGIIPLICVRDTKLWKI